jgi:phosphonate transport system substrate-binding protein
MIGRRGRQLVATGVALALAAAACGDDSDSDGETGAGSGDGQWPDELVFAAVPAEESTSLTQSYQHHIDVLEEELGLTISFTEASNYAGVIEGQIAGRVDIAQYGPFSYVIAKDQGAAIEPVGAMADEVDVEPGYQSYAIVPSGSDITSLEDFAGSDVCFVDQSSTSGYLYPSEGLLSAGVDPVDDVTPTFAGGHDASVIAVANGDCDAGFAYDEMVDEIVIGAGDIEEGDVEVVWESEVIAGSPIAVSTELPADLVAEIERIMIEEVNVDALVAAGRCEEQDDREATISECGVSDENTWGYAEVDDAFYDGVRQVCETTEAEACEEG